jgi:hypothetical protein
MAVLLLRDRPRGGQAAAIPMPDMRGARHGLMRIRLGADLGVTRQAVTAS